MSSDRNPEERQQPQEIDENHSLSNKPVPAGEDESLPPPVDLTLIRTAVRGKMDVTNKLVDHLLTIGPNHLANIREHIDQEDAESLRKTAHALKGTVGNFGAKTAFLLAQQIESLGKDSHISQAKEPLLKLEKEMARIKRYFKESDWQKEFES